MASGINYVTVLGNLTRDPDLRYTPNGTPVASFAIAVNKRIQNKNSGEWANSADFFNVVTWFKLAENCAESLGKGDRVLVTGRLSQESWNDKDGQKRSAYRIIANIVAPSLEFATCKIDKNARVEMPVSQREESSEELIEGDLDFNDEDIPF
ncbi:MAG: single-stranded DNA-binding protein [Actinobacteria bacterium]|nr:single-stranded DNA-binding protein [Actinomycetota bacterium]